MDGLIQVGFFLCLIIVGYTFGTLKEKAHFKSIKKRERKLLKKPTFTTKKIKYPNYSIEKYHLASGSVVISIDYFKRMLASLRNLFGGRIASYEGVIDRGRREAILRMKESSTWANAYFNMRIETSSISSTKGKKGIGCIEIHAYATAVKLKKIDNAS